MHHQFAPGTWTTPAGAAADASFAIRSGTKTVMHGTVMIRRGGLVLRRIRGLQPGRYTLVVTIRRGHRTRVLVRRTFRVRRKPGASGTRNDTVPVAHRGTDR